MAPVAWATVLSLALITCSHALAAGDDSGSCGAKAGKKEAPLPVADPSAAPVFFCETPDITMPDLWAGTDIQPKWIVKNNGTGDLSINIKGG
jgi:hypothetical protein